MLCKALGGCSRQLLGPLSLLMNGSSYLQQMHNKHHHFATFIQLDRNRYHDGVNSDLVLLQFINRPTVALK